MTEPRARPEIETVSAAAGSRLLPLDALRGLIAVLMAVDHANYFVAQQHSSGEHWGGPFPLYATSLAFITRLITHPVAPGFSFLMGVGMALFARSRRDRGWTEGAIVRHFVIRGAVLIGLQFTLVNLAWRLGPEPFPSFYMGVLAAFGGGMILGSLLLRLRASLLALVGVALMIGTEVTHPEPSEWGSIFDQPLGLIFGYSGGNATFWSNYPILPWLEMVVLGIAFGKWLIADERAAYRGAMRGGVVVLIGFFALRAFDGFGNIRPRIGDDWIGYLNVVKYPPALTFTLLTMGFNLIVLSLFARTNGSRPRTLEPLAAYGRVPLFFYVAHLYLYAGVGACLASEGTSLAAMYVYWLAGLLTLYPLCVWYGALKRRLRSSPVLRLL